jgi:hypothetical protein
MKPTRHTSARQRSAFVVALVLVAAWLTVAAGGSSQTRPIKRTAFAISGNATRLFVPGAMQSLDLTITNPHDAPLLLTSVRVTVEDRTSIANANGTAAGCSGRANMAVLRSFRGAVTIPGNTSESLSAAGATAGQLPRVQMRDRRVNQDGCKNVTFHFTYAGTSRHAGSGSRNGHNAR